MTTAAGGGRQKIWPRMKMQLRTAIQKPHNFEGHGPSFFLSEEHNATSLETFINTLSFKETFECMNSPSYSCSGDGFVGRDSRPMFIRIIAVHLVISNG